MLSLTYFYRPIDQNKEEEKFKKKSQTNSLSNTIFKVNSTLQNTPNVERLKEERKSDDE